MDAVEVRGRGENINEKVVIQAKNNREKCENTMQYYRVNGNKNNREIQTQNYTCESDSSAMQSCAATPLGRTSSRASCDLRCRSVRSENACANAGCPARMYVVVVVVVVVFSATRAVPFVPAVPAVPVALDRALVDTGTVTAVTVAGSARAISSAR